MRSFSSIILAFLLLHILKISAAQDILPANRGERTNNADTSANKFDLTIAKPLLTHSDSVCMFPAYNMYSQWDTTVIHPYNFDAACFKDSVQLILTGIYSSRCFIPRIGRTNSNFGPRHRRAHFGVDIDLETGDTVVSAFDGMVRIAKRNKSYGNVVIIRHENGLETIYAHLSKLNVQPNQCVRAGEVIGLGGNTGHSYGSHLHFEVRYKGEPLNPNELFSFSECKLVADTIEINLNSFQFYNDYKAGKYKYLKKGKKYAKTKVKLKPGYYSVRKGDTLYSIARKYGTTVDKLCKLNKIKPTTVLRLGTKIKYG